MISRAFRRGSASASLSTFLKGVSSAGTTKPLSIAAFLALILIGGAIEWSLWQDVFATKDMIAARQDLIAGLQRSADRLTATASGHTARTPTASPYLPGETDTIAAAEFQADVLKILEDHKATVFSAQVRPQPVDAADGQAPADATSGQRINLEVTFDARNVDLQAILFAIETSRPVLLISDMKMQPARATEGRETRDEDPVLHVVLGVYGFWRKA